MLLRSVFVTIATLAAIANAGDAVHFRPLAPVSRYKDALAVATIQFACAKDPAQLESYFAENRLPFEAPMLRRNGADRCHVFYQPTVAGFRASTEDQPITGIMMDINLLGFLSKRTGTYGDTLDLVRQVIPKLPRPMEVILGSPLNQDPAAYRAALDFYLPGTTHTISFRDNTWERANPWVQDYVKSGSAGGLQRILIPRLSYEGRPENGELFKPMLDSFQGERYVRSKLSWEGGDLQFVRAPKDPSKTILFYGDSAKRYWGTDLSRREFEYILKLEFGADLAVDFSDLTSHVDYGVAFLPRDNIALVSNPVRENFALAREAVEFLKQTYLPVPPAIEELDTLFATKSSAFTLNAARVEEILDFIAAEHEKWGLPVDSVTAQRIEEYADRTCPQNHSECATPEGMGKMFKTDPLLVRQWSEAATRMRTGEIAGVRMAALIRSQMPSFQSTVTAGIARRTKALQDLGFTTIPVPRIAGDPSLNAGWPGISYANLALIDDTLFLPYFGFASEQPFIAELSKNLPAAYKVVPVYARHLLLRNGGLHCTVGFFRAPAGSGWEATGK